MEAKQGMDAWRSERQSGGEEAVMHLVNSCGVLCCAGRVAMLWTELFNIENLRRPVLFKLETFILVT